jgi:DNA-binding YbaB/EbfC family protein
MDFNAAKDMMMKNMGRLKDKMDGLIVTGSAGGGMVEIDMNGSLKITAVRIEEDAVNDLEMLQDMIISAYNSASEKVKAAIAEEVGPFANSFLGMMS